MLTITRKDGEFVKIVNQTTGEIIMITTRRRRQNKTFVTIEAPKHYTISREDRIMPNPTKINPEEHEEFGGFSGEER